MKKLKKIKFNIFLLTIIVIVIISSIIMTILFLYEDTKIGFWIWLTLTIISLNFLLGLYLSNLKHLTINGKLAWVLSLLLLPIISIIFYVIWGRNPFNYKKNEYFKKQSEYLKVFDYSYLNLLLENHKDKLSSYLIINKFIYYNYKEPLFDNNNITIINDNEKFLEKILQYFNVAKKYIFMQYYILKDSKFLNLILLKLLALANKGIKIFILYDFVGSLHRISNYNLKNLFLHKNIFIKKFQLASKKKNVICDNYRSHKKMLIIDNNIAICGGSNIGDDYINIETNTNNFKDFNFLLSGPIIKRLIASFCYDWKYNAKNIFVNNNKYSKIKNRYMNELDIWDEYLNTFNNFNPIPLKIKGCSISFINTGPDYFVNYLSELLIIAINSSYKKIKIITPYFYPKDSVIEAINILLKRNIKVEIILPYKTDVNWFYKYANHSQFYKLDNNPNLKIYEYNGFIHTKLIVVDDEYVITGSFNLHLRSFNSNFENLFLIQNKQFVDYTNTYIDRIKKNSILIKDKNKLNKTLKSKIISIILKLIHPLI